jgi:DNA-directed RNA polymerase specialized sigma24 family protein
MQTGEATCNSAGPDLGLLMSRYQEADSAAAASLVELLSPRLYRFLAGQIGSQIGAEDMLQDVWLRIHRVRHTYRPGEPLLPWVYAIARCGRVDSYRRRRRIESHGERSRGSSGAPGPRHRPKNRGPGIRRSRRAATRKLAGSSDNAQGERIEPGGSCSRYFLNTRGGKTKGASCLSGIAQCARSQSPFDTIA